MKAFTAAEGKLRAQVEQATATLRATESSDLPEWAENLPDAAAAWESWDPPARRIVAGALFERIIVKPAGRTGRPAKGARAVAVSRLGFLRRGTTEIVWGIDDAA